MCREIYPEEMWYALEKADSGRISQNASTKYAVPSRAQQYELSQRPSRFAHWGRCKGRVEGFEQEARPQIDNSNTGWLGIGSARQHEESIISCA